MANNLQLILLEHDVQILGHRPIIPALRLLKEYSITLCPQGMFTRPKLLRTYKWGHSTFQKSIAASEGVLHFNRNNLFGLAWIDEKINFYANTKYKKISIDLRSGGVQVLVFKDGFFNRCFKILKEEKVIFEYQYIAPVFAEFFADTWFKQDIDFFLGLRAWLRTDWTSINLEIS